jgi:nicotinate-nucleotide adenylyltransferase
MNITLFGGSFDPPHLGHALVIQEFLASGKTDELWLLPTYNHSFDKKLTSAEDRVEMCWSLIKYLKTTAHFTKINIPVKLCTIEIDLRLPGSTMQTYQHLKQSTNYLITHKLLDKSDTAANIQFNFLMGSDQLPTFTKWDYYQELLQKMHFYIYPRANFPMEPLFENMEPFIHKDQTITNISSTLIRNRIKNQQDTSLLLPPAINSYIEEKKLYV